MRIIDKSNTDYYDGAVLYSPTPIYVRKTSKVKISDLPEEREFKQYIRDMFNDIPSYGYSNTITNRTMIGFCGKMYFVFSAGTFPDTVFADTPSSLVKKYNDNQKDKQSKLITEEYHIYFWKYCFHDEGFDEFKGNYNNMDTIAEKLCILLDTPIFAITNIASAGYSKDEIIVNPILTTFGFQCIISPWEASQSLEHYIGNVLVSNKHDNFTMSDDLKRDSKGMDEWSFKQKGPKKRKRGK